LLCLLTEWYDTNCADYQEHIYYTNKLLRGMNVNRILLAIIAGIAIFAAPSVLISPVLAQTDTDTQGTDEEDGNQGATGGGADDESPQDMYNDFQTCLEDAEGGAAGAEAIATEDEIRTCFIDAGYIQGTDSNNENENGNEEENEDGDEETNN
jgi:hypothetical protein